MFLVYLKQNNASNKIINFKTFQTLWKSVSVFLIQAVFNHFPEAQVAFFHVQTALIEIPSRLLSLASPRNKNLTRVFTEVPCLKAERELESPVSRRQRVRGRTEEAQAKRRRRGQTQRKEMGKAKKNHVA